MRYFLVALLFLGIVSCEEAPVVNHSTLEQEFYVADGDYVIISVDDNTAEEIKINVLMIGDSRCPADVTCFWAGNALVTFTVDDIDTEYSLCLGQCGANFDEFKETDEIEVTTSTGTYLIKLLEVNPYPELGNNDEKTAKFVITNS